MSHSRQLAAIMFTDIEGYTSLMQENEDNAIKVRNKHRQVFNSITTKHKGKILQYYGDGTLSIFNSAIEAVECGIEMQLDFLAEPSIPVRIGIHLGDIVFSEDEIIGDGVNVASRIESLAVPGSVFISDKVYDEIKNQKSLKTSLLKTFRLKNIERPTEVYAISNEGLIVPNLADVHGKTEPETSSIPEPQKLILATKIYIPQPRANLVPRPRLIKQLNDGMNRKLTLISAQAGFGKTTIVSDWIVSCDRPTAWLSLDDGDNDPIVFLSYLVAALQTIDENIGKGVQDLLRSPQRPPNESIMMAILNEIVGKADNFTLVLDDYHVIVAKQVNDLLVFLLDHLAPQMHIMMTTRLDPQLPLARLRVRGQLTELHASDLRFTQTETATFLNQAMGLSLTSENINILEARTEGWIAGLQLASLSMQGKDDITGFIKAFSGDDRYIVDYLVEEVLQSQPDHIRKFLLQTSILERLTGPLCDAVTNMKNGKDTLEYLERGNLFLVPLDDKRKWYRYHHLFAELLNTYLLEEQPDKIPMLHQQASQWYEKNNSPIDAIRHAFKAKDYAHAAGLVELAWPSMEENCQVDTWIGWAKTIPEEVVHFRPVLSVCYAWAHLNNGELEDANLRLNDAERMLGETEEMDESSRLVIVDKEQFRSLPVSISNGRAYHAQSLGDVAAAISHAKRSIKLASQGKYFDQIFPEVLFGFASWATGDLDEAYRYIDKFNSRMRKDGNIAFSLGTTFILAEIKKTQGRLGAALSLYEKALSLATSQGDTVLMGTEDLYRGIGDMHQERNELVSANQYLVKSNELFEQAALPEVWRYRYYITLAQQKEAEGDLDNALELLEIAESIYVRSPVPDVHPVASLKAKLWIRQGRLDKAIEWARDRELSIDDDISYMLEFDYLVYARLLIARYQIDHEDHFILDALALLKRMQRLTEEAGRIGTTLEIFILQALASRAQENKTKALAPLERALTLAEPENYVRIFVNEGRPMIELLTAAAEHEIMPLYAAKLLSEFGVAKQDLKPNP